MSSKKIKSVDEIPADKKQQLAESSTPSRPPTASNPSVLPSLQPPAPSLSQHTLATEINLSGIGLHSGIKTHVRVLPAAVNEGRYFVRVDLPEQPIIPATVEAVGQTVLSTELKFGEASVRTVEHLLAALAGSGVDNARIEIDGQEVPLLDGSAGLWVDAIAKVGLVPQSLSQVVPQLQSPIWVYQGDAFVAAIPAPQIRFTYGIDFDLPAIGNQWHSWSPSLQSTTDITPETREEIGVFPSSPRPSHSAPSPSPSSFREEIAPARTFGLAHQIESLRHSGLIKGGTLDNALVCGSQGWLNPPLRFANEPARHKILDLVGDLSLLGTFPIAHFFAYKASHNLHIQLAQKILDSKF